MSICYTINKLLFRKIKEFFILDCIQTFCRGSSWESPAWTTLTLVFHRIDCIFCSPVEIVWDSYFRKNNDFSVCIRNFSCKKSLELSFSPCWELIVSNSESVFEVRIDLSELSIFLLEELEAELEFFLGTERKTVFSHVRNKVIHEKGIVLFGAELFHTKIGSSLTDELHL